MTPTDSLYVADRSAWRAWLTEHHAQRKNVWLRFYKVGSPTPSVRYDEAVDEALCFGWIDSTIRKGDDGDYSIRFFSRRNPASNWSRVNKAKVERLTAAGLMTAAGQALVDLARKTGTWTALDDVEAGVCPPDLQAAFNAEPVAKACFDAFPRSARRALLEWLLNARTEGTRQRRIAEIVGAAARNERANQYRPKTDTGLRAGPAGSDA